MTEQGTHLLDEVLRLSTEERAQIAAALIASVDGEPEADAERAWAAEIERRARRALDGTVPGTDWETARDRIRRDPSPR